jgi:hypothetical protein
MATKPKLNLDDHISPIPASIANPDDLLRSRRPVTKPSLLMPTPEEPALVKFSNQLPANTLRRLQQYSFWSHETIGDVLDEAIQAFLDGKPEADKAIPEKHSKRRRIG